MRSVRTLAAAALLLLPAYQIASAGEAKQALKLGLNPVGVLDSSGFSSLHPGYYVVYFGIYDTEAGAQSHVIEAHRRGYRAPAMVAVSAAVGHPPGPPQRASSAFT